MREQVPFPKTPSWKGVAWVLRPVLHPGVGGSLQCSQQGKSGPLSLMSGLTSPEGGLFPKMQLGCREHGAQEPGGAGRRARSWEDQLHPQQLLLFYAMIPHKPSFYKWLLC